MNATAPALDRKVTAYPSATAALSDSRICGRCRERLPLTAFRPRWKGTDKLHSICRCCCRDAAREKRREQRMRRFNRFTSEAVRAYQGKGASELAAIVREAIREFGGLARMTAVWREAVEMAEAKGRLCSVVRSYSFFFACSVAAKQLQAEEDAAEDELVSRLSLEEAEREQLRLARRAIQADPTLAIRAAVELGWEVRPTQPQGSVRV